MDTMTPFYATKCMEKLSAEEPIAISKKLDVEKIYYDIPRRNAIVLDE